jgi:hypothetical protein
MPTEAQEQSGAVGEKPGAIGRPSGPAGVGETVRVEANGGGLETEIQRSLFLAQRLGRLPKLPIS